MLLAPVLLSFLLAVSFVAVEDYAGHRILPSRYQRSRVVDAEAAASAVGEGGRGFGLFGQVTVSGMGFGRDERLLLQSSQSQSPLDAGAEDSSTRTMNDRRSYNEIMLEHRSSRVPRWRKEMYGQGSQQQRPTSLDAKSRSAAVFATSTAESIRTLMKVLETLPKMQKMAENYQWEDLRETLRSPLLSKDMEIAASRLRLATVVSTAEASQTSDGSDDVIGFDWGSCAWRSNKCGALADAQEALDELDARIGLLEPYEVVFCLDIVERSVRDMLNPIFFAADRDEYSNNNDNRAGAGSDIDEARGLRMLLAVEDDESSSSELLRLWRKLPAYQPLKSHGGGAAGGDQEESRLDDDYLKALQELRIDDDE